MERGARRRPACRARSEERRSALAIRDLIESWALWRDTGTWDRLRTVWHADGRMRATWFQGTADEFIAGQPRGLRSRRALHHILGGMTIDISGQPRGDADQDGDPAARADRGRRLRLHSASAGSTISSRSGAAAGAWCCASRSTRRTASTRCEPGKTPKLDPELLARFPEGYRHLAYLQTRQGYTVKPDMPGATGPELEALYRRGAAWLKGEAL